MLYHVALLIAGAGPSLRCFSSSASNKAKFCLHVAIASNCRLLKEKIPHLLLYVALKVNLEQHTQSSRLILSKHIILGEVQGLFWVTNTLVDWSCSEIGLKITLNPLLLLALPALISP